MVPKAAAEILRDKLADPKKPMTVADASVASGLSTRDTEAGLSHLTSEYRGHLRVTEDGDLLHVFPNGFTKPWETRDRIDRFVSAVGNGLLGVGRFVIRAWLLVAMVSYALIFVALMIALTFARSGNSNNRGGAQFLAFFFRMIADALFWTMHPFSPAYVGDTWSEAREEGRDELPFYEKVNRFVFGPPPEKTDEHAMRARILAEIRAQKGRIGLADVMRVTGLPRDQADPLMARLMMDHEGTVDVAEQGGIVYTFEALRRSTHETIDRPEPAWAARRALPPLIGNPGGSNVAIGALNAVNLFGSLYALTHELNLSNVMLLLERHRHIPMERWIHDTPIALGIVPLIFSTMIFAAPIVRAIVRTTREKKLARENARLAILREVLTRAPRHEPVTDTSLRHAWRVATGEDPTSKEITARVVELGGDVDMAASESGEVRYRFADLEADEEALEQERREADETEAKVGKVVFDTSI